MEKLITNLIQNELTLEEEVKAELEKRFNELDLRAILANPRGELNDFTTRLIDEVFVKYSRRFVKTGLDFSEAVKKSKQALEIVNVDNSQPQAGSAGESAA